MIDSKEIIRAVHNRGFVSKLTSMVSLPYRRTKERQIVRRNGIWTVRFTATGDELPYGKYPRLFEAYVATKVITGDPDWNGEDRVLRLGKGWDDFLVMVGLGSPNKRGGRQREIMSRQMLLWLKTAYTIEADTDEGESGVAFTVGDAWHIDWSVDCNADEHPDVEGNWICLTERYIEKIIRDNPVPVDLTVLANIGRSPIAMDIYLWLNRRMSYLHESQIVTWRQLYAQFGSDAKEMKKFKQNFKRALSTVMEKWPSLKVTVSDERGVTLFPSPTLIPTVARTRAMEKQERLRRVHDSRNGKTKAADPEDMGHEQTFDGNSSWVFTTTKLFDVNKAREHRDGLIPMDQCPYCLFDERNKPQHGEGAMLTETTLF